VLARFAGSARRGPQRRTRRQGAPRAAEGPTAASRRVSASVKCC